MSVGARLIAVILGITTIFLSCSNYDPIDDNTIQLQLYFQNAEDATIAKIDIASTQFEPIYIFKELEDKSIFCEIPRGEDSVSGAFNIEAFVDTKLKYIKSFNAEIPEFDTTLVITLDIYDGPVPKAPTNVSLALKNSNTAIEVTWQTSEYAKGYKVYAKDSDTDIGKVVDNVSELTYINSSVIPEKTYFYAVSAYNKTGESKPSNYEVLTIPGFTDPPDKPVNVVINDSTTTSLTLQWDLNKKARRYYIFRINGSGIPTEKIDSTENTEYTDVDLTPQTTYSYAVSAWNSKGESPKSDKVTGTTKTPVPDKPLSPYAEALTDKTISITWASVPYTDTYEIYRSLEELNKYELDDTTTDTIFISSGLQELTKYYYKVKAKNAVGTSDYSDVVSATTKEKPTMGIPQNLKTEALSDQSISIIWDTVTLADSYEIYRSLDQSGTYELDSISDKNSFVSKGLTELTTYYYKVKAKGSIGISDFSQVVSATTKEKPVEKPPIPQNASATTQSPFSIEITWGSSLTASTYNLYRSNTASGFYSPVASVADTTYRDSGLSQDTEYFYKVSAENVAGESDQSNYVSAKTWIVITVPTGLNAESSSPSEVDLSWNSVNGADIYKIFRSMSQSGVFNEIDSTTNTTYTDTGLDANTTYYYKLSAKGLSGESNQTNAVEVTTKMPIPEIPTGLTATTLGAYEIEVDFTTVSGAIGYVIYSSLSSSGTYDSVATIGSPPFTHSDLESNTTYYYKVSAYSDGGESDLSDMASATTDKAPPDTPTGLKADAQSCEEIDITFNSVNDADEYIIYHSTSAGGNYTELQTISNTSYTHGNLDPKSTHYYKVSASNNNGESDLSNYVSETTPGKLVAYIRSCRECGRCDNYCDVGAIKYQGGTYVVDTDLCDGCGDCVPSCPYGYIEMIEMVRNAINFIKDIIPQTKTAKK